jgi:hypothetical protein
MHRKVIEILGAGMDFTLMFIASLEINARLCFMSSSDRRYGIVGSKVVQLCPTSCYRSKGNTLLVLKFSLAKFSLAKGILESCFASTLCLNVVHMSMLINDFL